MKDEYKILLIEDEPELAEMFSVALKNAGFRMEVIENGENALKHVKKLKPDLILLDLVIPKKDGYAVLKEIKCDKAVKNTLVYVFSNLTQSNEIERAMKLGAKDYLVKSDYTPSKLVAKVNEIFCLKGDNERC